MLNKPDNLLVNLTIFLAATFLAASFCSADSNSGISTGPAVAANGADNFIYSGAALSSIPIFVPPGRLGMAPNLTLNYNSQLGDGWVGVGWTLDPGSIQRSATYGVDYTKNDYIYVKDGSSTALVNVGSNKYMAKIDDGSFMQIFFRKW